MPTKMTCTEANLSETLVSKALLDNRCCRVIYAAVAANISTLRAFVTMVRIKENVIVNRAIATNRIITRSMKFRAIIDAIGRAEAMIVASTSAMRSSLLSLYFFFLCLAEECYVNFFFIVQRQPFVHNSSHLR